MIRISLEIVDVCAYRDIVTMCTCQTCPEASPSEPILLILATSVPNAETGGAC